MELTKNHSAPEETSTMGMPHITSFCWCMGLEMGSKLIGFVHLVVSIILIILCSIFAENARGYIDTIEDGDDHIYKIWYKIAVSVAVVTTIHVMLALLLLYSTYKRIPCGLRVWCGVMCVLYAAALGYVLVETCVRGVAGSGSEIFLAFLEGMVFFGVLAYCILCVNSYYLMLKSSEDMRGPNKSDY